MEAVQYLEAYDAISDVLMTIGYKDKSQPTKEAVINALISVKDITDKFKKRESVLLEVKKLLYAINSIKQIPNGVVIYEIKVIIVNSICTIQHEIVRYFFEEYYNKDIDSVLEYEDVLKQMINNYYCLEV